MIERRHTKPAATIAELRELKAKWRDQLFRDASLTPAAFKVGYAMADYMTMDATADAYDRRGKVVIWPSQSTIQTETQLSIDTVGTCIAQLIGRGHMDRLKRGNQFNGSNQYEIRLRKERR